MPRFITALLLSTAAGSAQAATLEALSFLSVKHGFYVDGGSPAGIESVSSDLLLAGERTTDIDAADAAVALDDTSAQIGCSSCDPVVPYVSDQRLRTTRPTPGEFAEARTTLTSTMVQDPGPNVVFMSIGEQTETRTGLAQVRLTSEPVEASATESHQKARTNSYTNTTGSPISFNIRGFYDAELTARSANDGSVANVIDVFQILFSGHTAGNLSYVPLDTLLTDFNEIGDGATTLMSFTAQPSGLEGLRLTTSASALGDAGFTEATAEVEHEFIFALTVDPFQTVDMRFGFSQSNSARFTPPPAAPAVPLPSAGWLLLGAFAGLVTLRKA